MFNTCKWRIIECQHCQDNLPLNQLPAHLGAMCKRYPLPCENKCSAARIAREEMQHHLTTECLLTVVYCKYKHLGCQATFSRNKASEHLDSSLRCHLDLVCGVLEQQVKTNAEQGRRMAEQEKKIIKQEKRIAEQDTKTTEQGKKIAEQETKRTEQEKKIIKQEKRIAEQETKMTEQGKKIAEQEKKMAEQGRAIEEAMRTIGIIQRKLNRPEFATVHKGELKDVYDGWRDTSYSEPFYLGGYKMKLKLMNQMVFDPEMGKLKVEVCTTMTIMMGEFDHDLVWPFQSEIFVSFPNALSTQAAEYQTAPLVLQLDIPKPSQVGDYGSGTVSLYTDQLEDLGNPLIFVVELPK